MQLITKFKSGGLHEKHVSSIAHSERDGTSVQTRFGLSAKRTSPFKPAEVSVQSTTGSRASTLITA